MVSLSFNSLAMRSSPQVGFSAAISRMSLRRSLGNRGLPTGRDFQRQKRRNPLRCQRRKVSGLTFTKASRHENMRPRMTILSRVESWARCGLTLRSWNKASCLRRKRFSAARARRDRETNRRRRTRSHATKDSVLRLCVSSWKMEPSMNAQLTRNRESLVHSRSLRDNQLKAKLLGPFCQGSDLLFAISGLVVFDALVYVLRAVLEEPVKQAGELAGHGRDGFGSSQPGAQTTVLRVQIALATQESHGRITKSHRGPIDYFSSSPIQDLGSTLLVGGAQTQPAGELLLAGKGVQVRASLGNNGLRREHIDAVDLGPVDAGNAIQLRAEIEGGSVPAEVFALGSGTQRLGWE